MVKACRPSPVFHERHLLQPASEEEARRIFPIPPSLDYPHAIPLPVRTPMANGDFFTRATWRAGKKRRLMKRTKPWGGQITAPVAFLEAAKRTRFKPGRPGHRVCCATKRNGSPCGRLALRGLRCARRMEGSACWPGRENSNRQGKTAAFRAAQQPQATRQAPPPLELHNSPSTDRPTSGRRSGSSKPAGPPHGCPSSDKLTQQFRTFPFETRRRADIPCLLQARGPPTTA